MRTILTIAATALTLGACSTAMEAVRDPELAPIGYPAALIPAQQTYLPAPEARQAASANSLWRTGARTFFGDQRARRIGDILTVTINIDDQAQTQNTTARTRTNDIAGGVSNLFGLENSIGRAFPGGFDPGNMIGLSGSSNANGRHRAPRGHLVGQHHRPHPDRRGPHQLRRSRRHQPRPGHSGRPVADRALQSVLSCAPPPAVPAAGEAFPPGLPGRERHQCRFGKLSREPLTETRV